MVARRRSPIWQPASLHCWPRKSIGAKLRETRRSLIGSQRRNRAGLIAAAGPWPTSGGGGRARSSRAIGRSGPIWADLGRSGQIWPDLAHPAARPALFQAPGRDPSGRARAARNRSGPRTGWAPGAGSGRPSSPDATCGPVGGTDFKVDLRHERARSVTLKWRSSNWNTSSPLESIRQNSWLDFWPDPKFMHFFLTFAM